MADGGSDILLVDDDPGVIQALSRVLKPLGRLRFAMSGDDALRRMAQAVPDLVLLDAQMPGMSGFEVLDTLKADPALQDVPVMMVTSHTEETFEQAGLERGAADFVVKPIRPAIVLARARTQLRLKRATDQLRRLAATDALTGLVNRRGFDEALERAWRAALRHHQPLALLMVDVDHFKRYNDHYGHLQGDACLAAVARALVSILHRPGDLACRYGGEEFAVLLPDTTRGGAEDVAAGMVQAVQALAMPHRGRGPEGVVSVSIGVSALEAPGVATPRDLVAAADRALYAAKAAGRAQWQTVALSQATAG